MRADSEARMTEDDMPTEMLPAHQIADARHRVHDMETKWLRDRGWKHTCETPGSYWMWERDWNGKTFLVDQNTATRIQAWWDGEEHERLHPEQYGA